MRINGKGRSAYNAHGQSMRQAQKRDKISDFQKNMQKWEAQAGTLNSKVKDKVNVDPIISLMAYKNLVLCYNNS